MNSESPLYSSRLLAAYMKLLRDQYPEVSISEIMAYAGIEPYEINDEGCWFTQTQVDLFHEKTVHLTDNKNIAREAGRVAASPGTIGVMRQHTLGILGPALAFKVIKRLSLNFTRSSEYQSRSLKHNKVEVTVTPYKNIEEKPFQCDNRKGFFEAIVNGFHLGLPRIEHPECLFEGGCCCRYILTWKRTLPRTFSTIRNLIFAGMVLSSVPIFLNYTFATFLHSMGAFLFLVLGSSWATEILDRQQMTLSMENLWDSSERLTELIDTSSRNVQLVQEIGQALINKTSVDDVIKIVTQVMESGLDFDSGAILIANPEKTSLEIRGAFGYSNNDISRMLSAAFNLDNPDSQGPFVRAFHEKKTIIVDNTEQIADSLSDKSRDLMHRFGVQSLLCCPIVIDNQALGIIAVTNQETMRPLVRNDVNLLQGIAPTIGVALQNVGLIAELGDSFEKTLKVLADSIDARDYLTAGHSEMVTIYAAGIAGQLGLADDFIQMTRIAALLHDYGKIGVPDSILKKNGGLTEEEREIINTHPVRTRQILSQVPFRGLHRQIPEITGAHHERWDGNGYPLGLKGEEIPLGARIIAAADFFEAITAKRHYREPLPLNVAVRLLEEGSGSHFDPKIIKAFLAYIASRDFTAENSPPRSQRLEDSGSRRKFPRVEYRTLVSIRHGKQVLAGDILNVSTRGLYIVSPDALVTEGNELLLTFTPPDSDQSVQVSSVVTWVNNRQTINSLKHPEGFAVSFNSAPKSVLASINQLVRKHITSVPERGDNKGGLECQKTVSLIKPI